MKWCDEKSKCICTYLYQFLLPFICIFDKIRKQVIFFLCKSSLPEFKWKAAYNNNELPPFFVNHQIIAPICNFINSFVGSLFCRPTSETVLTFPLNTLTKTSNQLSFNMFWDFFVKLSIQKPYRLLKNRIVSCMIVFNKRMDLSRFYWT